MVPPLGCAEAGDPGPPTINVRKHRWRAHWEVPELNIREHPPSTIENVDDEAPGRCQSWRSGSANHQHQKMSMVGPRGGVGDEDPGASIINIGKRRW
jgi:hypothetical protein